MPKSQHEPAGSTACRVALVFLALCGPAVAAEEGSPQAASRRGPVDASIALGGFQLPDDLAMELVAAEPDVIDPVAMTFGEDGRLWVVEMTDYPNGPPPGGAPLSRVRVLSDADGDGRFSDPVTFADRMLFANGLMLWNGGLLVTTDGEVLFLRDADGDGRADGREVWFRGFKRENPQLRANHPTLGLDNHIYIASGLRGGEVIAVRPGWAADAKPVSLSGRDFRFDPLTGTYEAVSGVGQFGMCFDDFGNRFVCSNRNPCSHIVLEERYLARNPRLAVSRVHEDVSPAAEQSRLYPISRIWTTSNLHANQFTAACGVLIYRGDALPEQYRFNSFTCEPTSNLVHRDVLSPQGATFTSRPGRDGVEFLATQDEWFRPVNLAHGPDGALYVVDMYRAVIEHPEFMPTELKDRPDLTDGSDRGRIYRIVGRSEKRRPLPRQDFSRMTGSQLVARLSSTTPWERDTAARLLLERQDRSTASELIALTGGAKVPATRVQALWLLDGLGELSRDIVATALDDPHDRVREQALRLAELRFPGDERFGDRCVQLLVDPNADGRLRFQAALSLGSFPSSDSAIAALATAAAANPGDQWMRAAIASSAVDSLPELLARVLRDWDESAPAPSRNRPDSRIADQLTLIVQFAEMVAGQGADAEIELVLRSLRPSDNGARSPDRSRRSLALLRGLARGLRRSGDRLHRRLGALDEPVRSAVEASIAWAASAAGDHTLPVGVRAEAIELMAEASPETALASLPPLTLANEQEIALAAIESLALQNDPAVGGILLDGFRQRTPRLRSAVLATITTTDRVRRLLDEIEAGRIRPRDIDPAFAQRLSRWPDEELKSRAGRLLAAPVDADRQEVINRYRPALALTHNLERGKSVFASNCATCHRVGDVGVNVGADISDTRTSTPEQLLVNILDPNKAVDGNYFGYSLIDTSGRTYTGIITAETTSSVTLRQPEAREVTVLRGDIEELASTGQSLMPVGLEKNIDLQQMADLIAYLKNWRYIDGAVPAAVLDTEP